jgi:phage terminase large subunit
VVELVIPPVHARVLLAEGVRHKALYGGRGSAKSTSIAVYLIGRALERPRLIVCARQFQNSIRDSSKALIERRIASLNLADQFASTERSITCANGSSFIFLGLERNVDSLRSLENVGIFWTGEARNLSEQSLQTILPTVREPGSELLWDWNPYAPNDPVDRYFRLNPPKNAAIGRVDYRDNPFFHQTALAEEMEKLKRDNEGRYREIWLGDYCQSWESRVFANVRIGRPDLMLTVAPFYGMDFGFSGSATAIVKCYLVARPGRRDLLYIAQEIVARQVPTRDLPALLDQVVVDRGDLIWCDSARPETIEALSAVGYGARAVRKGARSVLEGVADMQGYDILVDPSCPESARQFENYSWPTDRSGQVIAGVNPIKADDDCCDAVRYAVSEANPVASSAGEPEDGVFTLNLWPGRNREARWHERGRGNPFLH